MCRAGVQGVVLKKDGQSIGRRRFRYRHRGNAGAILRAARRTLGLSIQDMRRVLQSHDWSITDARYREIEADKTGWEIGAGEWWVLCQCLALFCDSLSYGYCQREHLMRVRRVIEDSEFLLRVTDKLKERIAALSDLEQREREQDEWRWTTGLMFQVPQGIAPAETVEV